MSAVGFLGDFWGIFLGGFLGRAFLKKSPPPLQKTLERFWASFSPFGLFRTGTIFCRGVLLVLRSGSFGRGSSRFLPGVFLKKRLPHTSFKKLLGIFGEGFFEKKPSPTPSKKLWSGFGECFPPFGLFRTGTFFVAVFYRRLCSLDGGVFSCHFPVILVLCGSFFLTFYKKNQNFARKKVICDFPAYFI